MNHNHYLLVVVVAVDQIAVAVFVDFVVLLVEQHAVHFVVVVAVVEQIVVLELVLVVYLHRVLDLFDGVNGDVVERVNHLHDVDHQLLYLHHPDSESK